MDKQLKKVQKQLSELKEDTYSEWNQGRYKKEINEKRNTI
jgi:hypothetical protein